VKIRRCVENSNDQYPHPGFRFPFVANNVSWQPFCLRDMCNNKRIFGYLYDSETWKLELSIIYVDCFSYSEQIAQNTIS
jgi:hypothetical protein